MKKIKADPTDILLFLIIVFFVAVGLVVALFANNIIKNVIDTTPLNSSAAYSSIESSFTSINEISVQRAFVIFFAFLIIGMMVSAFLIKVHPIFIFVYIIILLVTILTAVYLANTYETLVTNPLFADLADNYATITFVMKHCVEILIGVWALTMIIIFGKIGGGSYSSSSEADI